MKKLAVPLADLFLLLGLLVFFALGAGVHQPSVVAFDRVHLSTNGGVFLNDEQIDQFHRDEVDAVLTVEIAERLHQKFRAASKQSQVQLSVDGEALVGWNNRLVDVIYGIVEYELSNWKGFSYRAGDEAEVRVEVGLHAQATQVTADITSDTGFNIFVDEAKPGEEGLYLVVLGGGTMSVSKATDYVQRIFGKSARIGFEQRFELVSPPQIHDYDPRHLQRKYSVEMDRDGEIKVNGKAIGNIREFDFEYMRVPEHWFREPPFEGNDWHYLITVDEHTPANYFEDLGYLCETFGQFFEPFRPPVFIQIGESVPYQTTMRRFRYPFFKLELLPETKSSVVLKDNWARWPQPGNQLENTDWFLLPPHKRHGRRLTATVIFKHPTTVSDARARFRSVFGPNAELYQSGGLEVQADELVPK